MKSSNSRNFEWNRNQPYRKARAIHKANKEFEDDTAHAMEKPSELTEKQKHALERSERIKAARKAAKEARQKGL